MPAAGDQVVLLLLAAGLAQSGLLSAGRDELGQRASGPRRLERVPRQLHGWTTDRVADSLWADRRNMVRRNVGQAGCGLASGENVRADSSPATSGTDHPESSSEAETGGGRANIRARPSWTEHRRDQHKLCQRAASPRELRHAQRELGIQYRRQQLQEPR